MMVNILSSSNDSYLDPHITSTNSFIPEMLCLFTKPAVFIFSAFNIINICLFIPLCFYILCHGFQRFWLKKESLSHSDCFNYHLSVIELFGLFGSILNLCATFFHLPQMLFGGLLLLTFTIFGETFFHALTCVERHLAVVHPTTYLRLRNEKGIRIRNMSIGCIWVLCVLGIGLMMIDHAFIIVNVCILACTLPIVSFCSVSVLCALIHSGPGERGRHKEKVNPTKRRAFYTIMVILGMLLLRFAWAMVWAGVFLSKSSVNCILVPIDVWFNLPSSLILPMLFLHRSGKLVCLKNTIQ